MARATTVAARAAFERNTSKLRTRHVLGVPHNGGARDAPVATDLWLSALVLGEIRKGVELARRPDS